jgi:hypothetical protein
MIQNELAESQSLKERYNAALAEQKRRALTVVVPPEFNGRK